ncbi:MAG: Eco57I restriction-modification methylase domain-containing protein [Candidatus Thermoplasmatota archaeon]|nr:Eco57I restriction-modification methylase domain-containing protein [Candidatus Thermoplasmatota archaeon]
MKGHVPTPQPVVDRMVTKLFSSRRPDPMDTLLDPGAGDGIFTRSILRWCHKEGLRPPHILAVELNPVLAAEATNSFAAHKKVKVLAGDFLQTPLPKVDFVIGNPPYVAIDGLTPEERATYRGRFITAVERFDLYLLFFERALKLLKPGGRLCFITPEKFEYVHTATPLRKLLAKYSVEELEHVSEDTFPGLVTYPTITTLTNRAAARSDRATVRLRDGASRAVSLPKDGSSWNPVFNGLGSPGSDSHTLEDLCVRVSCGIATGADSLYVHHANALPPSLLKFTYPTVSGRQLGLHGPDEFESSSVMLVPYDSNGRLLREDRLGELTKYLSRPDITRHLKERSCVVEGRREWYRFHDNVPLPDILRPKILCKDITPEPHFWADEDGRFVPRHTIYYLVPRDGVNFQGLLSYLNSEGAVKWLKGSCQRAANGFYRVQSASLKQLPISKEVFNELYPEHGTMHQQATLASFA